MFTTIPATSSFSFPIYLQIYFIKQTGVEQTERSRELICEDAHKHLLVDRLEFRKHEQ